MSQVKRFSGVFFSCLLFSKELTIMYFIGYFFHCSILLFGFFDMFVCKLYANDKTYRSHSNGFKKEKEWR
jgi:hypothetical protein